MLENARRSRQARNFATNVPKILDLRSSSEQIFFRKLSLGPTDTNDRAFVEIAFKTAADQGIGFYAPIFVRTSLFFAAPFPMRQRIRFSTQNQGFPCSLFLCELNFKR